MSARRIAGFVATAAIATAIAGCGASPTPQFYALQPTATPVSAVSEHVSVMVGPVMMPASVERPEMVLLVSANRVAVDEFNRWDAPLDDSIARVIAGDLAAQLGSADVTSAPLANFAPDYRVIINVQRFESSLGESALVDAVWTVRGAAAGDVRSGRTVAREATRGEGYAALAAAHSRALAVVSADIAAAIRAEAKDRP